VHDVTACGIRTLAIVLDDRDRLHWLALLVRVTARSGWLVHAYCLLDNRFRLLAETPVADLSSSMQRLNGLHAQGFNSRHGLRGHLFDSSYRSEPVDRDSSPLRVCREVVLEPRRFVETGSQGGP
jgi:REP-associated tyrosine transposase